MLSTGLHFASESTHTGSLPYCFESFRANSANPTDRCCQSATLRQKSPNMWS